MPTATRTPRESWIDSGLRALAAGGPDAVRIDVLAQELGVTRGGFYWHFPGRDAFLKELLDTWERRSIDETLDRLQLEQGDNREKVWRAGMFTFAKDLFPIDLAVREWARRDKAVARRLRRVDNRRMEYLRAMISTFVSDPDEVEARSMLLFSVAIANHFIAADHLRRSRGQVLNLVKQQLLR